ncbi:hypothetical protein Tco_0746022 [Tanacetum coccineum]
MNNIGFVAWCLGFMKLVSNDPSYVTGGEPEYPQELFSAVDLLSLQFLGASCTQRKVSMVSFGRINPNSFLSSILLVVVIVVTVVIVVVILIVIVVAIVGVVIVVAIFGVVVVVDGVSLIFKLSFMIIVTFPSILLGNPLMKTSISFSTFGTMFVHKTANSWNLIMSLFNAVFRSDHIACYIRRLAYAFIKHKASLG